MKTLAELKQERAAKIQAQTELLATVRSSEKKEFTAEQRTAFDGQTTDIQRLDVEIKTAEAVDAAEKRAADLSGKKIVEPSKGGEEKESRNIKGIASVTRALRMATNGKALDGAEKEMNDLAIQESRTAGVDVNEKAILHIPMDMLRSASQTVTEDDGLYGGELVTNNAPRVQMPFSAKSFLEKLGAKRLSNLSGGSVPLPIMKNYSFQWLGETETITRQKQTVDPAILSPNRVGGAVSISNRLLMQSGIPVESEIRSLLLGGYDRALNTAAVNGPGTGNSPLGILNTSGVQQSAVIAGTQASRDLVLELISLLESSDVTEESLGFLLSPQLRYILQTTLLDAGSGRFVMEQRNNLQGYNAAVSTLVPELATNKVLVYGDWSKLFIGEWGSMSVVSNPYSEDLEDSVRLVANAHAGIAIAQPEAFAVNKFLTA
jgi:HK97 family phage major capsid protein